MDLYEFEVNLVYKTSSRIAIAITQRNSVWKNKKKTKTKNKTKQNKKENAKGKKTKAVNIAQLEEWLHTM